MGWDADAGVAHLNAQLRAKTPRGDEHKTAGGRVMNGISYQVSQHAVEQNRVTESRTASRSYAKRDPLQMCRFCKLCGEMLENGTQWQPNAKVIGRSLPQLQSLDQLAQHAGQSRGRIPGSSQLLALILANRGSRQNIMRAGDDLQRLAQIVSGHRQQRRREIAVSLICVTVHGIAEAPRAAASGQRRWEGIKKTDRLHLPVLLLEGVPSLPGPCSRKLGCADW